MGAQRQYEMQVGYLSECTVCVQQNYIFKYLNWLCASTMDLCYRTSIHFEYWNIFFTLFHSHSFRELALWELWGSCSSCTYSFFTPTQALGSIYLYFPELGFPFFLHDIQYMYILRLTRVNSSHNISNNVSHLEARFITLTRHEYKSVLKLHFNDV